MNNKENALFVFAAFFSLVLFTSLFTYNKYFIDKDYLISAEIPCDPLKEVCFVRHCDSEAGECTGVLEEDILYYKKIRKPASAYPTCDPNKENCSIENCEINDSSCSMVICDTNNIELECSSPENFSMDDDTKELENDDVSTSIDGNDQEIKE